MVWTKSSTNSISLMQFSTFMVPLPFHPTTEARNVSTTYSAVVPSFLRFNAVPFSPSTRSQLQTTAPSSSTLTSLGHSNPHYHPLSVPHSDLFRALIHPTVQNISPKFIPAFSIIVSFIGSNNLRASNHFMHLTQSNFWKQSTVMSLVSCSLVKNIS